MADKPLVSVILCAYNAEKYISESIKSVLSQTYENIQLIIVNDGSTDRTPDIVMSFNDPRIDLINSESNRHIANGTNEAFKKVRGDYAAIIDADDRWLPQKLEKQLAFMQANPQYAATFTWVDIIDDGGNIANEKEAGIRRLLTPPCMSQGDWLRFFFFEGNRLCNPTSLFRSELIKTIGPHSLFYIQATDMEWWVRVAKKHEIGILEEPLVQYRRCANDSISAESEDKTARFYNELMLIRYHFFEGMDDGLFIKEFGEFFRCPDSRTPDELKCEKAFLVSACYNISGEYSALGILMLEELMNDPVTAELLYEKYHFSTKELGKASGHHLFNDPFTQGLLRMQKGE